MAGLIDTSKRQVSSTEEVPSLWSNPMLTELQAALAPDCVQMSIPYSFVHGGEECEAVEEATEETDFLDTMVEEATLQAEFRQLASLGNQKVSELENFFNTQTAAIVTQRADSISRLRNSNLPDDHIQKDLDSVQLYFNKMQQHLIQRVTKSLDLLKLALPTAGGEVKNSKSRMLNDKAVMIMQQWYDDNYDHPYPSQRTKEEMAREGSISVAQVKAWFANKRNRTLNTKPKREKSLMQKQVRNMCEKMVAQPQTVNMDYRGLISDLSSLVQNNTDDMKAMNASQNTQNVMFQNRNCPMFSTIQQSAFANYAVNSAYQAAF